MSTKFFINRFLIKNVYAKRNDVLIKASSEIRETITVKRLFIGKLK